MIYFACLTVLVVAACVCLFYGHPWAALGFGIMAGSLEVAEKKKDKDVEEE